MKLYRFTGSCERIKGGGLIPIDHTITGNLRELKRHAAQRRTDWRQQKKTHYVWIESIKIFKITSKRLQLMFSEENSEILIESTERIQTWAWEPEILHGAPI